MASYLPDGVSTPEQKCIGRPAQKCVTGSEATEGVLSGTDGGLLGRAERSSPAPTARRYAAMGLDGERAHRAIIVAPRCARCCRSVFSGCCCLDQRRVGLCAPRSTLALCEPVALAVHFENVDVVGQAIQQGAGEPLGADAFMMPPSLTVWCVVREPEVD